ncbi:MAG: diaminopimelate epimerase [Selenomonadaceae bacterium]|nr:diaminopimelate epimerase [Selenomonadaceae bacterium]
MKKFEKWQGCGNDFVIINSIHTEKIDDAEKIIKMCDRHFGIGADGVIYVLPSEVADVRMRIFNADGSEAEMCGNGIRCFTKFLLGTSSGSLNVETGAGILTVQLENNLVTVDMGEPILTAEKIPVIFDKEKVIGEPLKVDGETFKITCVSMGNPHCVIFVDDLSKINLEKIGPKFENNKIFPRRTNTEFVEVLSRTELKMRVWERGSGITLACGTGTCATVVAANLNGLTEKSAVVHLDGGDLKIEWGADNRVYMTGAAEKVFDGIF